MMELREKASWCRDWKQEVESSRNHLWKEGLEKGITWDLADNPLTPPEFTNSGKNMGKKG